MPTWYPSSIIRQNDADDFGRQSKLLLDDLGNQLQDANKQITGHVQSLLPSLESLMPWAQGGNDAGTSGLDSGAPADNAFSGTRGDLRNPSGEDTAAAFPNSQLAPARPSSALPSLESLSPWQPQVQVGPISSGRNIRSEGFTSQVSSRPDEYNASPGAPVDRGGDLHAYARQAAERNGVDPGIFERQIQQESGFNPSAGSPAGAHGIAQIMPQYHPGVDTSDPYASLDYAAQLMGQHLKTYGGDYRKALQAYNAGPGAVASGAADSYGETNTYLSNILGGQDGGPSTTARVRGNAPVPSGGVVLEPSQGVVDQAALDDPDKWALCGPVAAVLAATKRGANWSVAQAKQLASSLGLWNAAQGMAGLGSEVQLLQRLGIQATTGAADEQRLAEDAQNGNTPIVSTDGHYFVLQGYDPGTGKFDTGTTGTVYKGGSRWLSLADMQGLAGNIQGAAYIDNPASSTPGSVASPTADTSRGQNTPVAGLDVPDKGSGVQFNSQLALPDQSSGDSTYGPFDPPGYADAGNPDQPSGLNRTPVQSVTPTLTSADLATGNTSAGNPPAPPQALGDLSNNLAGGLDSASDTLTGGLDQGADQLQTDPNTGQTYGGGLGLLQAGHNVARGIFDSPLIGAQQATDTWNRAAEIDRYARENGYHGAIDPRFIRDYPDLANEHADAVMQTSMGIGMNAPGITGGPGGPLRATGLSDPNNQKLAQMFGKPVPTPATTTPWYRRLAQGLTDDAAVLSGWERDVRTRLGPNAPATDTISDLRRINPDSVSTQRLKPLDDATSTIRTAGVDPDVLSVYLAHTHDLDIADSFGMRAWDAAMARGATPAQAQAAYDAAANGRTFSGGRHVPDIKASLQSLQSDLGPSRLQSLQDAAQNVWDLNGETRDRLFAAGGMDQATHADLSTRYPHYVTTDIVNHIDPESSVAGAGGGVSQRTNAIRELSAAGTASDRLDPLQSVVANTIRSERWIAKNTVFQAFHELVTSDPALATQLGITPSKPGGTKEVTGLINGQRETLRVDRPIAEVIEMGNTTALGILGEGFKALTGPFKAGLTTYNPAFQYIVNPLRDSTDFFTRQSAYLGGPQHLPEVMSAYGAAIKDVAAEGKWTQAYKAAGGSYERADTSSRGVANLTKDLTASGGEVVKDPRKLAFIARDVLTLGARPFGERAELVPRVAAFKMASERGASPVQSMIAGRNATIPFEVGGRWTKAINTAVPFLNATVQSGAQLGRSFRDHPVATTASMAAIVGTSALTAQAWNRSDPNRAAAYADVPDYLKRNGLVFMLPLAGSDSRGPLPNYVWIPLGTFAPAATAMNAAVEAKMGESSPDEFEKLLMGTLGSFSPIKGDSVGSALSSVIPPGISTARDLMANRDNFRGRTIASDAADRNASALAKGITGGLQTIGEHVPPLSGMRDIRPSQTDYVIRDLAGAPGQTASAAANMAAGQDSGRTRPVQDVPVLGGLAGRIIRDTGGQQLQNAQDVRVSPEVDSALRDAGLRPSDVIQPVSSVAKGVPLDRDQQLAYQQFMNDLLDREMTLVQRTPEYRNPTTREQAVRDAVTRARAAAADRVLSRIPANQQERLKRAEMVRQAG